MTPLILPFILGFFVALFLGLLIAYLNLRSRLKLAEIEAEELVRDAELACEMQLKAVEENSEGQNQEALEEVESEVLLAQEQFESAQAQLDQKVIQFETGFEKERRKLQSREDQLRNIQRRQDSKLQGVQSLLGQQSDLVRKLSEELRKRVPNSETDLLEEVKSTLKQEAKNLGTKKAQWIEQTAEVQAEREAKRILALVLNRFARPYCPERGIQSVHFADEAKCEKIFGAPGRGAPGLKAYIEKVCGVDIVFHSEYANAAVMGFDPVRRELGRLVLEALTREKELSEKTVDQILDRSKKQLFKKILKDGNKIAQELRIRDFHESIRSMLGALRYRYSYSQNQYFHVGEVGWLCGLLSAELGLEVERGRRAGVLHDIGKAMDHSKEGGHAVIGAEFIQENGEKADVVHAVRAHHYDEQPSTDLAYLTIAADAISGARPGARRSTVDSYTQKMADLEKIGNSFREVQATYILSAGREVRLFVDSHHVDDQKALELSKKVAQKIEDECNYPGMIKVTVVRQTQAVEYAQ